MQIHLILKNTIGLWLIMTAIILPFPYSTIPSLKFASSDSALLYLLCLALFVFSIIINIVLIFFNSIDKQRLMLTLRISGTYILAFFLIKYGIDKLFQNQFYTPEPNILHAPIGSLTKDIVFWTSMSSSSSYNLFMGAIEVFTGCLLFIPKTRLIAFILSIGITANIFMINIGFDISVKFLSGYLLLLSVYLFSFQAKIVYHALTNQQFTTSQQAPLKLTLVGRLFKASIIGFIFLECLIPFSNGPNNQLTNLGLMGKTFEFEASRNVNFLPEEIKRIHFNTKGYLITETSDQNFEDYRIHVSPLKGDITIKEYEDKLSYQLDTTILTLTYKTENYKLTQVQNEGLPLLDDSFHWTVEGFID